MRGCLPPRRVSPPWKSLCATIICDMNPDPPRFPRTQRRRKNLQPHLRIPRRPRSGAFSHTTCSKSAGRKTGKLYLHPESICWNGNGKRYLVAPRGRTQWVRNAEAAGEITLEEGKDEPEIPSASNSRRRDKPQILKAYLDSFKREVQRYFSIPAGSPPEAFAAIAGSYPAFELLAD